MKTTERVRAHGEVFTGPREVEAMLDLVADLAADPDACFVEPACGDGNFLVALLRRRLAAARARPGADQDDVSVRAVASLRGVDLLPDNVEACRARLRAVVHEAGVVSRATRATIDALLEDHVVEGDALALLGDPAHPWRGRPVDVVIGNPPYHREDGGHGRSARPLFPAFVRLAKGLSPRHVVMIVPSRWFAGGKGLRGFRDEMLADQRLRVLVDFEDATDCFPGVDVAGGVAYFRWDRDDPGPCAITNVAGAVRSTSVRALDALPVLVRHPTAAAVVQKVRARGEPSLSTQVSPRKPFGLDTRARPGADGDGGDVRLRWQHGEGPFFRRDLKAGLPLVDRFKVCTSYVAFDHAGRPGRDGARRVFSRLFVLPPGVVCNETYLVVGAFDSEAEARHLLSFLQTRLCRFLVAQAMVSHHVTRDAYVFVPRVDVTRPWTDADLADRYGLSEDETAFVAARIRPFPAAATAGAAVSNPAPSSWAPTTAATPAARRRGSESRRLPSNPRRR
jgi:hypothetical protein